MDNGPNLDESHGTIVFLFGAGCSADGGAPVMREFMAKAREYARNPDNTLREDYARLRRFRQECLRICYVFNRWWENIEDIYTQAHLRELVGFEDAKITCESIRKVIWDVYRRHHGGEGYERFRATLLQIKRGWTTGASMRPVIITTNYDVHLEAVLSRLEGDYQFRLCYPGDLKLDNTGILYANRKPDEIVSQELIEFVKLHGSVNWFEADGTEEVTAYTKPLPLGVHHRQNLEGCFAFQKDSDLLRNVQQGIMRPLIVPPTLGKLAASGVIAENWKRSVQAL